MLFLRSFIGDVLYSCFSKVLFWKEELNCIKGKEKVLSLLYYFWQKMRESKISLKHARNHQKVMLILVITQSFLREVSIQKQPPEVFCQKKFLKISYIPQVNTCVGVSFDRSIHWRCSLEKIVLKNFANFTGKHLCWSIFNKVCEELF